MRARSTRALAVVASAAALTAGCGGVSKPTVATTAVGTSTASAAQPTTTTAPSTAQPGALQAEANGAAAGDIPDNQVFLVFTDRAAGYSLKYPEGWAQQGTGGHVTFRDKNNIVRVDVGT